MLAKLNYLFSKGCLKEKPIRTFYLIIRVLIADLLKKKINYIANLGQSKFFYNYKPYSESGIGGRGQFILREYYDKFFLGQKFYQKNLILLMLDVPEVFFNVFTWITKF